VLTKNFENVREQGDAGAEQHQADKIERMHMLFAKVGQMQIDHHQAQQADGNIQEKDDAPVSVADNQAAGDGAEHGRNQCRN